MFLKIVELDKGSLATIFCPLERKQNRANGKSHQNSPKSFDAEARVRKNKPD
jgi:hypothetical protein